MESIPNDPFLKFNPTTLEDLRKCWNLENERMVQSVDILEEWMAKQNHFVNKKFSRNYLEKTLIACKGSVEKAKSQLDKLCTLKTLLPKFFIAEDVKNCLREGAEIVWMSPLPKLTKDHYRGFILKFNPTNFTSAHFIQLYQLALTICEYLKGHDYTNGFILIEDYQDVNLVDIMTKINFVEFQQFITILIEGYGARIKGIHILTQSKVVDVFVKTFKPMLSSKIADRMQVHKNLEELHTIISKELLPIEYGGEEKSLEELKNDLFEKISSKKHEEYLAEMKASCTDESLRASEKYNEQIMGLPGSFRALNVD